MITKKILVLGSSNTDMTVRGAHIPVPGETVAGGEFTMGAGGKGANQAVAASRLGGDVTFICKVGRDLFGDNAVKGYEKEGIDTGHILRSEKASGVALINVGADGANSISVASGANFDFTPGDLEGLRDVIEASDYLLLQLEIPVETVLASARIAREAGVFVILNPAPAAELPEELYPLVDIIIPNEIEASALSGVNVGDEVSAARACSVFRSRGTSKVIITMGSAGAFVSDERDVLVPVRKTAAVDTTAAGDTFCGALCVALSEGKALEDAVCFANSASSISVLRCGAQDSIPTRGEVDALMASCASDSAAHE